MICVHIPCRSAYVHVPFCSHRCGYCNFTVVAGRDDLIAAYLEGLSRELSQTLSTPQPVETLFLGGGTPSHLQPAELEQLLQIVTQWLPVLPDGEFSCEANPLDCTLERHRLLREYGVNRISLGGQSFDNGKLRQLERDHSGIELRQALERCAHNFPRVSLDLIFAVPGESLEVWKNDLAWALASPVGHLSTYGLTIERGAAFYSRMLHRQMTELTADDQLDMYRHAIDCLSARGWEHYEVSNFALRGIDRCRHNEAYWLGKPWWAFGPGAASFEYAADGQSFFRRVNHRSTTAYLRKLQSHQSPVAESERLTREDFVRERLVFGLRRLAGVDLQELSVWWEGDVSELFEPYLSRYVQQGWLERSGSVVRLTAAGLVISDGLWPDLLVSPATG